MEQQHGLVKFQCDSAGKLGTAGHKLIRATIRPASLTEWYVIRCVMEELERVARSNASARFIVDFHRVEHVSVEILPELLWLRNSLEQCGGTLHLSGLRHNLRELLRLIDFHSGLHINHEGKAEKRETSSPISATLPQ